MKSNTSMIVVALSLACIITNISQMPMFIEASANRIISALGWAMIIAICAMRFKKDIGNLAAWLILAISTFMMIQCLATIINPEGEYFFAPIVLNFFTSIAIFLIGYFSNIDSSITTRELRVVLYSYVISAAVVGFFVFIKVNEIGAGIETLVYAYKEKNSISQIIFTALLIIVFFTRLEENKLLLFAKSIVILLFTYLLLILKSRATLIMYPILFIYLMKYAGFKKRITTVLLSFAVLFGTFLFLGEGFFSSIYDGVIVVGRDISDWNDVSSNRIEIISSFPELIGNDFILGIGDRYFECFYLAAILNHGMAGIILILVAFSPLYWACYARKCILINEERFLQFLSICYLINGIFECVAPFGPGAKCYLLWLIFGILYGKSLQKVDS